MTRRVGPIEIIGSKWIESELDWKRVEVWHFLIESPINYSWWREEFSSFWSCLQTNELGSRYGTRVRMSVWVFACVLDGTSSLRKWIGWTTNRLPGIKTLKWMQRWNSLEMISWSLNDDGVRQEKKKRKTINAHTQLQEQRATNPRVTQLDEEDEEKKSAARNSSGRDESEKGNCVNWMPNQMKKMKRDVWDECTQW